MATVYSRTSGAMIVRGLKLVYEWRACHDADGNVLPGCEDEAREVTKRLHEYEQDSTKLGVVVDRR